MDLKLEKQTGVGLYSLRSFSCLYSSGCISSHTNAITYLSPDPVVPHDPLHELHYRPNLSWCIQ